MNPILETLFQIPPLTKEYYLAAFTVFTIVCGIAGVLAGVIFALFFSPTQKRRIQTTIISALAIGLLGGAILPVVVYSAQAKNYKVACSELSKVLDGSTKIVSIKLSPTKSAYIIETTPKTKTLFGAQIEGDVTKFTIPIEIAEKAQEEVFSPKGVSLL